MVLTLELFRENFKPYPVPRLLEHLLAFQNTSRDHYSWGFELARLPQDELRDHVVPEAISQFFCFGHDGTYSLYALWRYKEIPLDEAPVVYFNAEAEGSGVLASTLLEFLTLLALDKEPNLGKYEAGGLGIGPSPRNQELRDWLELHYGLHAAEEPNAIVQRARSQYPALPLLYPAAERINPGHH